MTLPSNSTGVTYSCVSKYCDIKHDGVSNGVLRSSGSRGHIHYENRFISRGFPPFSPYYVQRGVLGTDSNVSPCTGDNCDRSYGFMVRSFMVRDLS